MALEIERKFLVKDASWKGLIPGVSYRQGYLSRHRERTVRVRTAGERGYLTIKGSSRGAARSEYEYEIPHGEALELLALCEKPIIEKVRYRIAYQGVVWEVDEFGGENRGLVVAEVELATEDQAIQLPPWVGAEVTTEEKYYNSSLVRHPYSQWWAKSTPEKRASDKFLCLPDKSLLPLRLIPPNIHGRGNRKNTQGAPEEKRLFVPVRAADQRHFVHRVGSPGRRIGEGFF